MDISPKNANSVMIYSNLYEFLSSNFNSMENMLWKSMGTHILQYIFFWVHLKNS